MKIFFLTMLIILIMTSGNCSDKKINLNPSKSNQLISWPLDWSLYLNKKVTIKGTAVDSKLGALLLGQGSEIWIDGLDAWPAGFYLGGRQGKLLQVTGIVIERNDLPVFVPKEGEQPKAGIPVNKESDLTQTSKRFLRKDANWEIIKN
ncbi:MAG: hypothetical protein FD167_696 [bacterium]|nr:MAG: hypothetical protein FD167_696 [bacterium]